MAPDEAQGGTMDIYGAEQVVIATQLLQFPSHPANFSLPSPLLSPGRLLCLACVSPASACAAPPHPLRPVLKVPRDLPRDLLHPHAGARLLLSSHCSVVASAFSLWMLLGTLSPTCLAALFPPFPQCDLGMSAWLHHTRLLGLICQGSIELRSFLPAR